MKQTDQFPGLSATMCLVMGFLSSFAMGSVISAIYGKFFIDAGMSPLEANLPNVFFYIFTFLLEIPTGIIADMIGKKRACFLAAFIYSIGLAVYAASTTVFSAAIAEIILAVGAAFNTGVLTVWIDESLKLRGFSEARRNKMRINVEIIGLIGHMVAVLLGSYLYSYSIHLPFLVGSILSGGMSLFIIFKTKDYEEMVPLQRKPWREHYQDALDHGKRAASIIIHSKILILITLSGSLAMLANQPMNMQWQVALKIEPHYLGATFLLFIGSQALGKQIAKRMLHANHRTLEIINIGVGISMIAIILLSTYWIFFIIINQTLREIFRTLRSQMLINNIHDPKIKATTISVISSFQMVIGCIGLLVSGYLANTFSYAVAWIAFGGLAIVLSLSLMFKK